MFVLNKSEKKASWKTRKKHHGEREKSDPKVLAFFNLSVNHLTEIK